MSRSTPYRSLIVVYALAAVVGICEFIHGPANSQSEIDIYGDPARNFPEAMVKLYPGRPETEYLLGRHFEAAAGRRFSQEELQRDPRLLQQFLTELNVNLREADKHYERALAMGLKSEENLLYNHALTLIRIQADPRRIDRAIAAWKRQFPFSDRRDLQLRRQSIDAQLRQLKPAAEADKPWRERPPIEEQDVMPHPDHDTTHPFDADLIRERTP